MFESIVITPAENGYVLEVTVGDVISRYVAKEYWDIQSIVKQVSVKGGDNDTQDV